MHCQYVTKEYRAPNVLGCTRELHFLFDIMLTLLNITHIPNDPRTINSTGFSSPTIPLTRNQKKKGGWPMNFFAKNKKKHRYPHEWPVTMHKMPKTGPKFINHYKWENDSICVKKISVLFQKVYITSQNLQQAQTCIQKFAEAESNTPYSITGFQEKSRQHFH